MNKNLIYFTLGNNPDYVKLAELCVKSLYLCGYDGDMLFITNLKDNLLNTIKFIKEPYFIETDDTNLLFSSANKLKLYNFNRINEFNKIIFSDLDILWLSNPNVIFERIKENLFYVSNEESLLSDEWWGKKIITEYEKNDIIKNNIKGINAGLFAFNNNMVKHLIEIENFLLNNKNLINECLEQPFFNVYLYRNKIYDTNLTEIVTHKGYNLSSYENVAIHFAGGPGNFKTKYEKMSNFFSINCVKK